MNVKQGDMAITVDPFGTRTGLSNSGRIVEVLRFVGPYRYAGGKVGLNTWLVKQLGSTMRAYSGKVYRGDVFVDDANLRPIRPDGITTEEVSELFSPSPAKESEKVGHE